MYSIEDSIDLGISPAGKQAGNIGRNNTFTVVHWTLPALHEGLVKITLTVPLKGSPIYLRK